MHPRLFTAVGATCLAAVSVTACGSSVSPQISATPDATSTEAPESTDAPTSDPSATSAPTGDDAAAASLAVITTERSAQEPDQHDNYWDVEYPSVSGIEDAIASKVNATIREELGIEQLSLPDDLDEEFDGISWQEDGSFIVGLNTPQLLSFEIDWYLFTGGAHGLPATWFLTFDLATGELVDPLDLLAAGAVEVLSPLVREDLDRQLGDQHDAQDDVLLQDPPAYSLGFTADGALAVQFQAYGIGPYSMGMPRVEFTSVLLWDAALVPADGALAAALDAAA